MDAAKVKQKIASQLQDCEVRVEGEGANYSVTVIGEVFRGLSPVKKQQLVYSCLTQDLSDGTIHALTIRAFTPDQLPD
ncbi:MAG: cell division protein BolA [Gammaproteobacteria bacterium]|nr:MAG: cell division protein BolA [Pseudomonadota bacterium]PIE38252.1 MAG: cell division protein BolA [Gammaproteobacteria bacterium]